jgi:hypothetical protein
VLGDHVAQLQPQLVLALALQGAEGVVVEHLGQLAGGLAPALLREGGGRAGDVALL